jgi:glucose dehydrogenase
MTDINADVIVVGSGIAGALLAARLANVGMKIALLEAGQRVDRAAAVELYWNAATREPESPYPPHSQAEHPITSNPDYWYRQVGPDKFKSTYLKVVGGTTWHWLGTTLRFLPNDFA